ncbi:helix-turn-helix domain-containing protein [Kitasatospora cineracea]
MSLEAPLTWGFAYRRPVSSRRGRRPALDPEVEKRLLDAVRAGVPVSDAAPMAGVHPSTVYRWLERAEEEQRRREAGHRARAVEQPFCEFRDRFTRARSEGKAQLVLLVRKAATGGQVLRERVRTVRDPETGERVVQTERDFAQPDWRAAQFLLACLAPETFGRAAQARIEVAPAGGGELPVEASGRGDAVDRLAARLSKIREDFAAELAEEAEVVDAELVDGPDT